MATTIEQQVALDEALVPSAQRLRIRRSNFRLPSDIQSKESTLQVVYDVLRRSPFFKAFLVTADVPEIYMHEFWATAYVHQHSIRFKMDTKKNIVDLEAFRDMLHISPRVLGQSFAELPFEEEILKFLRTKAKGSARRKRGGSASSTTPPTPIATPTPITTVVAAPRLTAAAKGKQPARATSPTDPSDVERTEAEQLKIVLRKSRQETHISQQGASSTDEGTDVDDQTKGRYDNEGEKTDESDDDDDDQDEAEKVNDNDDDEEEISKIDEQEATESGEGDDEETKSDRESEEEETTEKEDESFDSIPRTPEESEDDGNGKEDQGLRIISQDIDDSHVTLTPVHSDGQQESSSTSSFVTSLLNPIIDPCMESIFTTGSSSITPIPSPKSTMTPSIMTTTTTASQPPIPPTPIPSEFIQNLPTFALVFHFEDRVKSLEVNFSEFMRTNQSPEAVSNIPGIVHQYMHQEMTEAVREAVQIQTDRLQDSFQIENDEFLGTIDDNMKKIIKEQAEVLTRSSHSSRTSYAVAVDLSEMELKKILIDKMEGNKSIQRSDEQRNLYKALVDTYEADKTILDSYGESTILKRRREDDDDQEGPSAVSDRGSKRRREGGEHASASTPSEPATTSAGRSTTGTQSRQMSASESAFAEEPVRTTFQMDKPSHPVFETGAEDQPIVQTSQHPEWFSQPRKPPTPDRDWNITLPAVQGSAQSWISELAKQTDARSSFNELIDTPIDFSNFIMNRLGVDTLTPELLAGPTYELMRGSCNSLTELEYHLEEVYKATTDQLDWVHPEGQQYPHNLLQSLPLIPDNRDRRVIPFEHFINNDLEYLQGGVSSQKYTTSVTKTKAADYGHIKWIEDLVPRTMWIQEPLNYDKYALRGVSHWR
uniref:Uncharacterized protein n=1 Tax=Tanacetum cinerariifolium TaxID=118510 RepID=A0A6L2NWR2_TANCI|nr:hypothetical protein [Tanacetum cinerariifolium]